MAVLDIFFLKWKNSNLYNLFIIHSYITKIISINRILPPTKNVLYISECTEVKQYRGNNLEDFLVCYCLQISSISEIPHHLFNCCKLMFQSWWIPFNLFSWRNKSDNKIPCKLRIYQLLTFMLRIRTVILANV